MINRFGEVPLCPSRPPKYNVTNDPKHPTTHGLIPLSLLSALMKCGTCNAQFPDTRNGLSQAARITTFQHFPNPASCE